MAADQTPGEDSAGEEAPTDEAYQRLKAEHTELEGRINRLEEIRFPTPGEELEIKSLKKRKLTLKTEMEQLLQKN